MRLLRVIFSAVLFVVAFALVYQNRDVFMHKFPLSLDLFVYQVGPYETYNIVLVGISFIIGVLFAVIWGALYAYSSSFQMRRQRKRVKELEKELGGVVREREVHLTPQEESRASVNEGQGEEDAGKQLEEQRNSPFETPHKP